MFEGKTITSYQLTHFQVHSDNTSVKKAMINFIQSITESELKFIAQADYGSDADIYYKDLRNVISEQQCILTLEQHYYPGEVISLCSHYLTPKHEREFSICICLVLLNRGVFSLNEANLQVWFNENKSLYRSLDPKHEKIIFDAFSWAGFVTD
ncbi:hypothetical protein ACJJIF_13630 [Microbulbifer sp. SSSA002]|uniref:hypothetical protein n=1 Tax=Microbulbifer sp. SSSA002 TaxID=3243376 RepID=UPI00403995DC